MKLIIKQYLSLLKESGGLDAILPDLLLAMGIHPISKAQRGIRQYGVDIAAVGPDEDDEGKKKLFLLTVKKGDFGRSDWDVGKQAVRPSLNEILDVYIPSHIAKEHQPLPIKIVVCAGGDLKQELQLQWAQFVAKNSRQNELEFDFWGGDKLSLWIDKYLLNENLFPEEPRKHLRKAIALVGEADYDLRDYHRLLDYFFTLENGKKLPKSKCMAAIRTAILCTGIVIRWAQDEDDLRQAFIAAERLILQCWEFMRLNDCIDSKQLSNEMLVAYAIFQDVGNALYSKTHERCYFEDGFFVSHNSPIEHSLRLYEFIGIFAALGIDQIIMHAVSPESGNYLDNAKSIATTLSHLIKNNPAAMTPLFDWHANEIALTLTLFAMTKNKAIARMWIEQLIGRMTFAYVTNSCFPVMTNSHDDLLSYFMGNHYAPETLRSSSSILPLLAEFCAVFGFEEEYSAILKNQNESFKGVNFQSWQPDKDTEEKLYGSSARDTGICFNTIQLPGSLSEFVTEITERDANGAQIADLSCLSSGMPILTCLASRHFRTPLVPQTWRQFLPKPNSNGNGEEHP